VRCDSEGGATYGGTYNSDVSGTLELPLNTLLSQWYAVQTRPRHEKKVAAELARKGIKNYVPLLDQIHRWSDRRKKVEVPLFPGYAFVHAALSPETRISILRVWGVLNFVGSQNLGTPIPEKQIESIRMLMDQNLQATPYPFLRSGQRVIVRSGALAGLEGIFLGTEGRKRLVISIESIQQSVVLTIEGYDIQPL
jgi:transcription antitermination factor NusG